MVTAIIDYGAGNLRSVENALKSLDADYLITGDPETLKDCTSLILPGVGSFPTAMNVLRERGLDEAIKLAVDDGVVCVGICLGMQLMFESSSEHGGAEGLSLFPGRAEKLPAGRLPVPNIGWWSLEGDFDNFDAKISSRDTFYFVHSYGIKVTKNIGSLYIEFNGSRIYAALRNKNVFGMQFHPEKSQVSGLKMLKSALLNV